MGEKLRGGMIGGGAGSLIGPVHRMAARLDGEADIVSGVFSSDAERGRAFGRSLHLPADRLYATPMQMIESELSRPDHERVDFVTVCTPNTAHYGAICALIDAGFHVISDKPITATLEEAKDVARRVTESDVVFGVTHTYTGYPMVKQARHLVKHGDLGRVHKVVVEYSQGWMAPWLNATDPAGNPWRADPEMAGISCTMADIGTHAENLIRYVTGLEVTEMCADLSSFIPTNPLDDDGNILLRFGGGAKGVITASQVSTGEENGLSIRVFGDRASVSWHQENPNYLTLKSYDGLKTIYSKGNSNLCDAAQGASRLPPGHPDGFIEAFANLYLESFKAIRAKKEGQPVPEIDVPDVGDGVRGLQFVETVLASAASTDKWSRWIE